MDVNGYRISLRLLSSSMSTLRSTDTALEKARSLFVFFFFLKSCFCSAFRGFFGVFHAKLAAASEVMKEARLRAFASLRADIPVGLELAGVNLIDLIKSAGSQVFMPS